MHERFEKIKAHLEKHKTLYACVATAAGVATFTAVIMRGRYVENPMGSNGHDGATVRLLSFLSNRPSVVTVIQREGRGHPGYIVRCIETGDVFLSQTQAAAAMLIPEKVISHQITGKTLDANGYHFERVAA